MAVELTDHAKERMEDYRVSMAILLDTLHQPDSVVAGYSGRRVYQKRLNGHILRVIVEEQEGIRRIITVYKARAGRYGI